MNISKSLLNDLKAFGIYKDGNYTIPEAELKALKEGRVTNVVELKDLQTKNMFIESLPARLSIVKGEDGNPSLRIDPVYREPNTHPRLNNEEKESLLKGELTNLKKSYLDQQGKMQTEIIEYDEKTKQFMSFNPRNIKAPEEVNGYPLNPEQKRKFKEGEIVELPDDSLLQISTTESQGIRSNRKALVLSVLIDGGLSYFLFSSIQRLRGKSTEQEAYKLGKEKGYAEALVKVQQQIERRIALNPNDKDAVNDLSNAKSEIHRVSGIAENFTPENAKKFNSVDTEEGRSNDQNERTGRKL